MLTKKRKLEALTAAVLLTAAAPVHGGPLDIIAELYATDVEPEASGCAIFHFEFGRWGSDTVFSVHVEGIQTTDAVLVLVPDDPVDPYVGCIELTDGAGDLDRDASLGNRIPEGSTVWIVDPLTGNLLLFGSFD